MGGVNMHPRNKNFFFSLYDLFMLHLYVSAPIAFIVAYLFIRYIVDFDLLEVQTFHQAKLDYALTMVGTLITIIGLFGALPKTENKEKLLKAGHGKILSHSLLLGTGTSFLLVILSIFNIFAGLQVYLFIWSVADTIIAISWIYNMMKYSV